MTSAGSSNYKNQMTDDADVFYQRVGILAYPVLEWLDLPYDSFSGTFWPKKLALITKFCEQNPTYHIISITAPGRYENKYVPDCQQYLLGKGDRNPHLVLDLFLQESIDLFLEEGRDKTLAIFRECRGSRE